MLTCSTPWLAALACAVLTACTPAAPEASAPAAGDAQQARPQPAPAAPTAGCASPPPSGAATSKLRHVPDENDPCQNSRGMAPQR